MKMNDMKEMVEELNAAEDVDIKSLVKLVDSFSESTDVDNELLIHSSRRKLAEIFTLEKLKELDRHIISSKIMNFLLSAETVADYENAGTYLTTIDDDTAILLQVVSIRLTDGEQIHMLNIQEETKVTNSNYEP